MEGPETRGRFLSTGAAVRRPGHPVAMPPRGPAGL